MIDKHNNSMNANLKHAIISSNRLVKLINKIYRIKNKKKFNTEVMLRKQTSLFDFEKLSSPLPYCPYDVVIDNNLYGISYMLKTYSGIPINKSLNSYIEHGLFFGNLVREDQKILNVHQIVTFGNSRKTHLLESNINKEIIPIGPFIHYAEDLYSEKEMRILKNKLGRTLLVFPSHSIIGVSSSFDISNFINFIEDIKREYDSVLISLYWVDAQNPQVINQYKDKGYTIVTSGHRYDPFFLSRQKALIQLSDMTVSNNVGTHVGYCIYLNRPHYIYQQDIKQVAHNNKYHKHFHSVRDSSALYTELQEKEQVLSAFSTFSNNITPEQEKVIEYFWGTKHIKTNTELRKLLSLM